jgi:hypothetical protein
MHPQRLVPCDQMACIGLIGPEHPQTRALVLERGQRGFRTVTIMPTRRGDDGQDQPKPVDERSDGAGAAPSRDRPQRVARFEDMLRRARLSGLHQHSADTGEAPRYALVKGLYHLFRSFNLQSKAPLMLYPFVTIVYVSSGYFLVYYSSHNLDIITFSLLGILEHFINHVPIVEPSSHH